MVATKFSEKVYQMVKLIPKGKVSTYKDIALALGTKAYRAVGNALNKNPYKTVPCHRIVKSDGSLGGYSRGISEKIKLLKSEGILIVRGKVKNFSKLRVSWQELLSKMKQ